MADILLDVQGAPATPSAGQVVTWFDTTTKCFFSKDDTGLVRGGFNRSATASQGAGFATDTYLTNSGLQVPGFGMQAGMQFRWTISLSKTAAGVAAPVFTVRLGPNQTTADTSRVAGTGPAQTAAADVAILTITVTVRSVGASGVLALSVNWSHNGAAAGFANNDAGAVEAIGAAFDNSAVGGQYLGLSLNGGASAAWTVTQVQGRMEC